MNSNKAVLGLLVLGSPFIKSLRLMLCVIEVHAKQICRVVSLFELIDCLIVWLLPNIILISTTILRQSPLVRDSIPSVSQSVTQRHPLQVHQSLVLFGAPTPPHRHNCNRLHVVLNSLYDGISKSMFLRCNPAWGSCWVSRTLVKMNSSPICQDESPAGHYDVYNKEKSTNRCKTENCFKAERNVNNTHQIKTLRRTTNFS